MLEDYLIKLPWCFRCSWEAWCWYILISVLLHQQISFLIESCSQCSRSHKVCRSRTLCVAVCVQFVSVTLFRLASWIPPGGCWCACGCFSDISQRVSSEQQITDVCEWFSRKFKRIPSRPSCVINLSVCFLFMFKFVWGLFICSAWRKHKLVDVDDGPCSLERSGLFQENTLLKHLDHTNLRWVLSETTSVPSR